MDASAADVLAANGKAGVPGYGGAVVFYKAASPSAFVFHQ